MNASDNKKKIIVPVAVAIVLLAVTIFATVFFLDNRAPLDIGGDTVTPDSESVIDKPVPPADAQDESIEVESPTEIRVAPEGLVQSPLD